MNSYPYIILDDNPQAILDTRAVASAFHSLSYVGSAGTFDDGIDLILEKQPKLVFLEINPENPDSGLSLSLISELHRFMNVLPDIVVVTRDNAKALQALRYGVFDYMLKPLRMADFRKMVMKLDKGSATPPMISLPIITGIPAVTEKVVVEKSVAKNAVRDMAPVPPVPVRNVPEPEPIAAPEVATPEPEAAPANPLIPETAAPEPQIVTIREEKEKPLVICIKSYGDYRFIEASDICYLQADNNSTDIHLSSGEVVTAFKTLKHFEGILPKPFVRIHNSHIVNADFVSRVHTGNAICYIKNGAIKLPFSKSYKEKVEEMLKTISSGNYLEI